MTTTTKLQKLIEILNPVLLDSENILIEYFDKEILNQPFISVDLESDRNERFGHNLSLIQLGNRERQFIVDPISLNGSDVYKKYMQKLLTDSKICKLLYSGMEDIQVLRREFSPVKNIYDVQYAYAFSENSNLLAGLDKSVKNILNVDLPVELYKYQKTDWSKRPLTDEMIWYASFDVAFLIDLYDALDEQLQKDPLYKNYMRYFASLELIEPVDEELAELVRFLKMHDYNQLDPLQKLLAYRLHKFRIKRAKRINRPSHFILNKRDMDQIMKVKPTTVKQFKNLQIYRFKKDPSFRYEIVGIVKETLDEFSTNPQLYDQEVKPIEELILKVGRKDLHLVNKDFTLALDIDIDLYKQRKYILNQWRAEKSELQKISRKDLVLSQFTINHLATYDLGKERKLPDIQGIDDDFKNKYEEEIVKLFSQ